MNISNCDAKCNCTGIAIIASIIIGIIAAFLQITAVIDIAPIILGSAIIIALIFLAVSLIAVSLTQTSASCQSLCSTLSILLIGILGSVLFATVLLIIDFAATSVVGAIFVGALLFSFSLLLSAVACLIKCIARCNN